MWTVKSTENPVDIRSAAIVMGSKSTPRCDNVPNTPMLMLNIENTAQPILIGLEIKMKQIAVEQQRAAITLHSIMPLIATV